MSGVHWSGEHVAWLRGIIPELADEPVYLRRSGEVPAWLRPCGVLAWSSNMHDLQMRPTLKDRGEWRGRGHFVGVANRWDALPLSEQRGVLLHEMAHSLCGYDSPMRCDESEFSNDQMTLLEPDGPAKLLKQYDATPVSEDTTTRWAHDLRFVRCGIHLAARCWNEVLPSELHLFGPRYALGWESSSGAIRALMPEVRQAGHIIDVLRTPPPAAFSELFSP